MPTQDGIKNTAGGGIDGNEYTVDGVNIHKPRMEDELGIVKGKAMSEGCFLIKRGGVKGTGSYEQDWNDFMGNFNDVGKIGVILIRTKKPIIQKETVQSIEKKVPTVQPGVKQTKKIEQKAAEVQKKEKSWFDWDWNFDIDFKWPELNDPFVWKRGLGG